MLFSKYNKQFRILLGLIFIVILIGLGSVTAYFVRYSATNEQVCAQCHPEHIEMWRNSNGHPAEITRCFECHSRGLKIVPKNLNIFKHLRDQFIPPEYYADDELTSQRCLECHEDVLDLGYEIKKEVIKFTHRYHFEEGLDCVDCHRTAAHEYMTGSSNRPTVLECLECHRKEFEGPPKNQKCLNCHKVMLAPGKTR